MAKPPLSAEQAMRSLNVKLSREDARFVHSELRPQLGYAYDAETVREVIARLRTWFHLPAYVARVLEVDAEQQRLHLLAYLQALLLRRYDALRASSGFLKR